MLKELIKNILKAIDRSKAAVLLFLGKKAFMGRPGFLGSIFDRFDGLSYVKEAASGKSVLDIACSEGLISYEMARSGAKLLHGFDIDRSNIVFAGRLFRDVPVPSFFSVYDFSRGDMLFARKYKNILQEKYDIVLFLGIYHHLARQMDSESLDAFVSYLLEKTGELFVVRTSGECMEKIEKIIFSKGFSLKNAPEKHHTVGLLRIYGK